MAGVGRGRGWGGRGGREGTGGEEKKAFRSSLENIGAPIPP